MTRPKTVGFDRRLNLEWLDAAAARAAAGDDIPTARAYLERVLTGVVDGAGKRGSRAKTVTVLLGVWHRPDPSMAQPRRQLLDAIAEGRPTDRVAAHWAMCMLSYPFFGEVAAIAGRLLALQGTMTWSQVRRRVRETWGDRQTPVRAANRILRSWVRWGVLTGTKRPGEFRLARRAPAVSPAVAEVLVEAILRHGDRSAVPTQEVVASPASFPFHLGDVVPTLRRSGRLHFHRGGSGEEAVALARSGKSRE